MSPHSSRGNVVRDGGGPHPRGALHPTTNPPRLKRRKTKRERDAAKFGRKIPPPGGGQRGAKLPFLWRGRHPPTSPLLLPKTVVITQSRLCQHRGLFNHEVKSVDVERLLSPQQDVAPTSKTPQLGDPSPAPEGDPPPAETPLRPPEAPQKKEGQHARELASRICAILARVPVFLGCDLVGKRRRAIVATLLQQHQTLPDLSFLLAHRNHGADAAAQGQWSPRTPEQELSTERGDFREQGCRWDTTPPYASPLGPLQAIRNETLTYPTRPATPSPIFGSDAKKEETPFSWTSGGEDSQCPDSPAVLFQPRGELPPSWGAPCQRGGPQPHGGLLPSSSPPAYTCGGPSIGQSRPPPPPPPDVFEGDAGEGCSWSHEPAFSPVALGHRRPPSHSVTAPFAPQNLYCGDSLPPRPPDSWNPEGLCCWKLAFAPSQSHAKHGALHCRHHHPLRFDPLRCDLRHFVRPPGHPSPGSCCWQPPPERAPCPETHRRWNWEDWWNAPELGCRQGLGEQGWLWHMPAVAHRAGCGTCRSPASLPRRCWGGTPPSRPAPRPGAALTWGCAEGGSPKLFFSGGGVGGWAPPFPGRPGAQ